MYEYGALLVSVHDGDTCTMAVDLGFYIYTQRPVRLDGVDAPELRTPEGKTALAWAVAWFGSHPSPYTLKTRKDSEFEKFGRILGRITSADGHCLNDDLLAAGQAREYHGGPR